MKDILFKNIDVYTGEKIIKNAYVGISGEYFDYIGTSEPEEKYERVIEGSGKVLAPALVNAHSHAPMTLLRGAGEELELMEWLETKIFPREEKLNNKDIYIGTCLAACEMIKSGTISFSDMYFMCEDIIKAVVESGMKINCSCGVTGDDNVEDVEYTNKLYKNFHNMENGRIKIDFSIHAEYTSTPMVVESAAFAAKEKGAIVHLHLSETEAEHNNCIKKYKLTPTAYFEKHHVFENKVLAAHGVYITDSDIEILYKNNASLAHNPVSNLKLGSGIADIDKIRNKKVNIALGTDGAASNNTLDMFEEMKTSALLLNGINRNASKGECAFVYDMASINGYKAQGRENCGRIKKGFFADAICLDFDQPHLTPCYDILSHLIFACRGSDVVMTICNGRVLYEQNEFLTIDEEKIKYEANKVAEKL